MKSSLHILTVLLVPLLMLLTEAVDEQGTIVYEKKRAPKLFSVSSTRVAGEYVESMKMISESKMSFGGQSMDSTTTIVTESDVLVKDDFTTGGSHITATATRMEMITEAAGFKLECDTDNDKKVADPMCLALYDTIDTATKFDLGADGNIVDACGPGSDIVKKAYVKKTSSPVDPVLSTKSEPSSDSASKYVESWTKISRMLQLVPSDTEIKPGDKWDSSSDLGEMGHFEGTGTMLGYRTVDDRDCAVFSMVGTLQISMDKMGDVFGSNALMASVLEDLKISDTTMNSLIYYDYELGITRWSKTHQTSTMTMPDPTGEGTITVPMDTTAITSCRVK